MARQGVFLDLVGLSYRCDDLEGSTTADFAYFYKPNQLVSFFIGPMVIGETVGKPVLTLCDLVPGQPSLSDPKLLNRARLLFSLAPGLGFEKPMTIDDKVRDVVAKYASQIDLDAKRESDLEPTLSELCSELGLKLKTVPHVRNQLRRAIFGCRVMRDIKIPTRDGELVYCDVFLPLEHGNKYPVMVSCTCYGKRVVCSGPDLDDPDEIAEFEKYEDDWHSTTADVDLVLPRQKNEFKTWTHQRVFECNSSLNSYTLKIG